MVRLAAGLQTTAGRSFAESVPDHIEPCGADNANIRIRFRFASPNRLSFRQDDSYG